MTSVHSQPAHRRHLSLALLVALMLSLLAPRPALADGAASTRNIILGAAALAAGVIIYNNVAHKRAIARSQQVGYTRDGGVVYGDGRIVYPNGRTLYSSNGNGRPCSYGYDGERCGARPVAYHRQGDNDRDDWRRHDNGNHRGWSHAHGHDRDDRHDHERGHHDGD